MVNVSIFDFKYILILLYLQVMDIFEPKILTCIINIEKCRWKYLHLSPLIKINYSFQSNTDV